MRFTATRTEMENCRVVGPRGLCRPLDEKQGFPTNKCSKAGQAGRLFAFQGSLPAWGPRPPGGPQDGQAGQKLKDPEIRGRLLGPNQAGAPGPLGVPQTPSGHTQKNNITPHGREFGVHLYCRTAERSMAGLGHYNPRIPGGFTLPHCSDGTLDRGPRSEPERPCKWSAALSAVLEFRV